MSWITEAETKEPESGATNIIALGSSGTIESTNLQSVIDSFSSSMVCAAPIEIENSTWAGRKITVGSIKELAREAVEEEYSVDSPQFWGLPKINGYITFGDDPYKTKLGMHKKPNKFHLFMRKWILGIGWEDAA